MQVNGEFIEPYVTTFSFTRRQGNGIWLAGDGLFPDMVISSYSNQFPELVFNQDLTVYYDSADTFWGTVIVYNQSCDVLCENEDLAGIAGLPAGTYYVCIRVSQRGEYYEDEDRHASSSLGCFYKLIK